MYQQVPAIVYLEKVGDASPIDLGHLPSKIDEQILRRDTNIAM